MRKLASVMVAAVGLGVMAMSPSVIGSNPDAFSLEYLDPGYLLIVLLSAAIPFAIGLGLLIKREPISARLFPEDDTDLHVDGPGLVRAALIVIGVLLVIVGVTGVAESASRLLFNVSIGNQPDMAEWVAYTPGAVIVIDAIVAIAKLAVGLIMLKRSASIAQRLWG